MHTAKVVFLNKFIRMKRLFALALVVLIVAGLASCGSAEKCPAFIGSASVSAPALPTA
jgi:predicted small lipoprotein YifL